MKLINIINLNGLSKTRHHKIEIVQSEGKSDLESQLNSLIFLYLLFSLYLLWLETQSYFLRPFKLWGEKQTY